MATTLAARPLPVVSLIRKDCVDDRLPRARERRLGPDSLDDIAAEMGPRIGRGDELSRLVQPSAPEGAVVHLRGTAPLDPAKDGDVPIIQVHHRYRLHEHRLHVGTTGTKGPAEEDTCLPGAGTG